MTHQPAILSPVPATARFVVFVVRADAEVRPVLARLRDLDVGEATVIGLADHWCAPLAARWRRCDGLTTIAVLRRYDYQLDPHVYLIDRLPVKVKVDELMTACITVAICLLAPNDNCDSSERSCTPMARAN